MEPPLTEQAFGTAKSAVKPLTFEDSLLLQNLF